MCLLLVACLQFCFPSETFALTLVSWLALLVSHLCSLYQHLPQLTTVNIMPNLRVINTTLFDYYAISFSVTLRSLLSFARLLLCSASAGFNRFALCRKHSTITD